LLYIAKNTPIRRDNEVRTVQTINPATSIITATPEIALIPNKTETATIAKTVEHTEPNVEQQMLTKIQTEPELKPKQLTGKEFILSTGQKIKDVAELKDTLKNMNNETFNYHVNADRNDFATWVRDVFKEYELAHKIRAATSKDELENVL
jgi:hypothetical protein